MSGFIQGEDRSQATLFPERLDDYVAEDSAVRVSTEMSLHVLAYNLKRMMNPLKQSEGMNRRAHRVITQPRPNCDLGPPSNHLQGSTALRSKTAILCSLLLGLN